MITARWGRLKVKAKAYCSSANLGSGFDVVAVALDSYYDMVELDVEKGNGRVEIVGVKGPFAKNELILENTALHAIKYAIDRLKLKVNVTLNIWKGIPIGVGLGSSGATAAAAVKGLTTCLNLQIPHNVLVEIAGKGEEVAAKEPHYDNVAASMLGGLIIIYSQQPLRVARFDIDAYFVIAVPNIVTPKGKTGIMRSVIPKRVELENVVYNTGRLVALIAGFLTHNLSLAGIGMNDSIVEPARAKLVPCYDTVRREMLDAGAEGVALSGAGPSMIALCSSYSKASEVAKAARRAYEKCGLTADVKIAKPAPGVEVEVIK